MPDKLRLTVLSGPDPGVEVLLEPLDGLHLSVGRSPECALSIDDPTISRQHFEIVWTGENFGLTDLGSSNGTLVNEQRVADVKLSGGERIQAGDIEFQIDPIVIIPEPHFAPRAVPPPSGPPEMAPILSREKTLAPRPPTLFSPAQPITPRRILPDIEQVFPVEAETAPAAGSLPGRLAGALHGADGIETYALVNAATNFELSLVARLMGMAVYALLDGDKTLEIAAVGPNLVAIDNVPGYLDRWIEHIGDEAGLLFQSNAGLDAVHAHLRSICVITDQQGQEFILRYFEPEKFRTMLPTLKPGELQALFGPISSWICENEEGDGYFVCAQSDGKLYASNL